MENKENQSPQPSQFMRQSETNSAFLDYQKNYEPFPMDKELVRLPYIPVNLKLQENKERRMILEQEKERQRQQIIRRRKQKQEIVQRNLREKQQAKENAKLAIEPLQKSCAEKFMDEDINWRKAEDIDEKIFLCRNRAQNYKTMYQKKLHNTLKRKQRSVKERKLKKDEKKLQASLDYHLAEWNKYEKKITEKHQGQPINENRLYDIYLKKEQEIKNLMEEDKIRNKKKQISTAPAHEDKKEPKKLLKLHTKQSKTFRRTSHPKSAMKPCKSEKIMFEVNLSTFGLQKSIKNPEKLMKDMKKFLQNKQGIQDILEDQNLLIAFESFLSKDIQTM